MLSIAGYRMEPALADLNTQFARYAKSWCSAHANWTTKRFLNFYRFGYCQSRSPSTGRTVEAWTQNGGRWRQILSFSLISRSLVLVVGQNVEYNSSLRFGELVKTFSEQRKPFGLSQKIVMFSLISEWLSGNWSWYIWGEEKGSCITKGIKGGGESSPGRGKVEGDFSSIRCVKTGFLVTGKVFSRRPMGDLSFCDFTPAYPPALSLFLQAPTQISAIMEERDRSNTSRTLQCKFFSTDIHRVQSSQLRKGLPNVSILI